MQTESAEMGYFERPEGQKKIQIGFRVSPDLSAAIDDVVRLWRIAEEAQGGDPDAIDRTYVAIRLITVGVEGAFAELGERPETEPEWQKLKSEINKKFSR